MGNADLIGPRDTDMSTEPSLLGKVSVKGEVWSVIFIYKYIICINWQLIKALFPHTQHEKMTHFTLSRHCADCCQRRDTFPKDSWWTVSACPVALLDENESWVLSNYVLTCKLSCSLCSVAAWHHPSL